MGDIGNMNTTLKENTDRGFRLLKTVALLRSYHFPADDNGEHRQYQYNQVDQYYRYKTRVDQRD